MKKRSKQLLSAVLLCGILLGLLPLTTLAANINLDQVGEWTCVGDAKYDEQTQSYILTPDSQTWKEGAMWYNLPVVGDFTLELEYYGGKYLGADGITIAFWADSEYELLGGENIAFTGSKGYGIELDTYYNSVRGDPYYNHIGLIKETTGNHLATARLQESGDGQWHKLKVVVENNICSAYVDGNLKLCNEVMPTGYSRLGITAATGDSTDLHAVRVIATETQKMDCFDVFVNSLPKLSPEEAKVFIEFICSAPSGEVNPDNTVYGPLLKLMTGDVSDYDGDLTKLRAEIIAMTTFVRAQSASKVNSYSQASQYAAQATMELAMTFAPSDGKISDADLGILSEYQKKVQNYLQKGLYDIGNGIVADKTGIYIGEDVLENLNALGNAEAGVLKSIDQVQNILNGVMTAVYGLKYTCSQQLASAYGYFNNYLCTRSDSLDTEAFKAIMDTYFSYYQLAQENVFSVMANWMGIPNWTDVRDHIDKWAEYIFMVERAAAIGVESDSANINHTWTEDRVLQEPDCKTEGAKEKICQVCGKHKITPIEKKEHTWSEWITDQEPTENVDGTAHRTCAACGETEKMTFSKLVKQEISWTLDAETVTTTYGQAPEKNVAKNNSDGGGDITYSSSKPEVAVLDAKGNVQIKGAGVTQISATAAAVPGQYVETTVSYTLVVQKKKVTVSADSKKKRYGEENPALTFSVPSGGLVGSDKAADLGVTLSCAASATSPAGTPVAITGTADSKNYEVTVTPGVLTISKAKPTGKPAYKTVSSGGKTLADAELCIGTLNVEGSLAWDLVDSTEITCGTRYKWTFIPADSTNYETLSGSVVLWASNGGGDVSSDSDPVAEVTAPADGWKLNEENRFTVSGDSACVVAVTTDGGTTYTVLEATENEDGSYSFSVTPTTEPQIAVAQKDTTAGSGGYGIDDTLTADTKIVVLLKGDTNGNGEVDAMDIAKLKAAARGKLTLDGLNKLAADINGDGKVNAIDLAQLKAATLGKMELTW